MTPAAPARPGQELLERYAALAFDKQTDLYEVIGDNSWNVDMAAGTISFGPQLVFPIQVLGSFSHQSETWLWAWDNAQSDLPEPLLAQARQLRAYGEQHGIDLLTVNQFDATPNDLHAIGSIASGMFEASGYYLADYGQGILVVTVESEQIDQGAKHDFARVSTVFPQVIGVFEMRHRPAFIHYITQKGGTLSETADTVTATLGTSTLTAHFDELGRLAKLQGTARP
ncbi:DUF6882 domain-containing protein [Hymenobacter ruricola]|uniref:Uncharacterized protein n=1 Tax=Hymenobacter ruricola TaxID=2791023 RepID=A0ABS0I328_9BACT|nr:DUF6882 domain-containing protein [Hymenobacter ruricola]MBF9221315.1 hypothetical protein [Hymenobacter ruricola]